jgi:nucleoside 2-deoxyribosyltransferase
VKIYLSAPLFTQVERRWNRELAGLLEDEIPDATVLLPQDIKIHGAFNRPENFRHIYDRCIEMLEKSDLMVAILDGPDVDSGVSFEMGYARALDMPIVGVRTDYRESQDRGLNIVLAQGCTELLREMSFNEDPTQLVKDLSRKIMLASKRQTRQSAS